MNSHGRDQASPDSPRAFSFLRDFRWVPMGSTLNRLARGLGSPGMENAFESNAAVVRDGGRPPAMQDQAVSPQGAISRVSRPRHSLRTSVLKFVIPREFGLEKSYLCFFKLLGRSPA